MIKLIALVLVITAVHGNFIQDFIKEFNAAANETLNVIKHSLEEIELRKRDLRFVIKHKSSGVYMMPVDGLKNGRKNIVTRASGFGDKKVWQFEHYEKEWGYIRYAPSGQYLQPVFGALKPLNWDALVLLPDKHAGCLFALDANRDIIIHKGGLYAQPGAHRDLKAAGVTALTNPPDNTYIYLRDGIDDAMKWLFVDPDNTYKEVLIYGKPKMTGYWKRIFTAINPQVGRTKTETIVIGKSNETGTESSFKYEWEVNIGFSKAFEFGLSHSVEQMFSTTTKQTWSEQTTESRTISVIAGGPSVVIWQYVFAVEQNGHRIEYNSNIIADTDSITKTPDIDVPTKPA